MSHDALHETSRPPLAASLQGRLVEFVQLARDNGFRAGVAEVLDAQQVARICDLTHAQRLRWGLRSLLSSDQNDWGRFDELFDAYWKPGSAQQIRSESVAGAPVGERQLLAPGADIRQGASSDVDQAGQGEGEDAADGGTREGASRHEVLARTDFQFISDAAQMREVDELVERLSRRMRRLMMRRQKVQRQGRRVHLRGTVRNSLRYGGTPLELAYRQNRKRQPRLLILIDVSRSMSLYSYVFLRFARGLVNAFRDADAFAFHTRLVHITDALNQPNLGRVKKKLALISSGWSGGTRIGECIETFHSNYGQRLNSRSVVLVVSDGLDTGEPQLLGQQLGMIKRQCRKLIWLNPLLGRPGYEPRTGGMLAALPHLDLFAPVHNLESLCALESELVRL